MQVLQETDALLADGTILGRSPLDGSTLEPVPVTSLEEITAAVRRSRVAHERWAALGAPERAARLRKLRRTLLAQAPALASIMQREQGKSLPESYTSEMIPSADLFPYWAKMAPRLLAPQVQGLNPINFPKKVGMVQLRPKGVVALIAPWNFPLAIPLRTLVPALAAGNSVVLKPSEYAPRIGAAVAALFEELGVPDLVTVVQGGAAVGRALIEAHPDHVVFTGSERGAREVASACADLMISCSLEAGGKDAAIVLADADLDRAADGIVWGAFMNAGQNCASIERVLVVESVAAPFIEKVLERTARLRLGGPGVEVYDVGPVVRPEGLVTIEQHVADALEHGATLRAGGRRVQGPGTFYEPTVLTDVTEDMAVMTEETFGPVMPILVVADEEQAVAVANRTVYGLTTSVWTRDPAKGRALAPRLRCGVVTVNNHAFPGALPHAPWHGLGHSGGGTTNSPYAFYEMCHPTYLVVDRNRSRELHWFPHNQALATVVQALARLLAGTGGRLAAAADALRGLMARWK